MRKFEFVTKTQFLISLYYMCLVIMYTAKVQYIYAYTCTCSVVFVQFNKLR